MNVTKYVRVMTRFYYRNCAEKDDKIFCKDDKDCTVLDESADSTLFTLLGLSNKNSDAADSSEANAPMSFTNILNNLNKHQTEQQVFILWYFFITEPCHIVF